jgi:hypothetical protein
MPKKNAPPVEWSQSIEGDWFVKIDGNLLRCVCCGSPLDHTENRLCKHKCRASVESAKQAAVTREMDLGRERTPAFSERLKDGFRLLGSEQDFRW